MARSPMDASAFRALATALADEYAHMLAQHRELQAELQAHRGGGDPAASEESAALPPTGAIHGTLAKFSRLSGVSSASGVAPGGIRQSSSTGNGPAPRPVSIHSGWSSLKSPTLSSLERTSVHPHKLMRAYTILEDPDSTAMGRGYRVLIQSVILASVVVPLMQTVERPLPNALAAAALDTGFDVVFILESIIRLWVSPAPRNFLCSTFNLIDLASVPALALRAWVGFVLPAGETRSPASVALLCVVPLLRLLKVLRRWDTIHLLTEAFANGVRALPILLFPLLVLTLSFAMLIYVVEPQDNVPTLAQAVWLTIVTMTTVGYGDMVPASTLGHFVVGALVICSVIYMAMPLAIVGASFTEVWQQREFVLLVHRTRLRLTQWGYTAHEIPRLFQAFSKASTGELSIGEFCRMFKAMRLGLEDEQIMEIFRVFDADGSGTVDDKEFVRILFPSKYIEVYGETPDEDGDGSDGAATSRGHASADHGTTPPGDPGAWSSGMHGGTHRI